ncbi:hypothetical protein J2W91_002238 [Paenibacillus amylolyticus]|uniref:Lipoprotein n=1 Tax=Paenibacillus amylolyticus TaxID=1451 RepID=A0AAP5H2I5_PAEAM|nr:hypothetical protein [Paenibacillus amylolyticus]MDR6723776.1 hypothetical protein [Paenibacillus amylolyticus]
MRKQKRWVIIPVTTAVLLALAGCGGQDTNTSAAEQTPSATTGEQVGSGNNSTDSAVSQGNAGGATSNTDTSNGNATTTPGTETAGTKTGSTGTTQHEANISDVVKEVRSQAKMKNVVVPTAFNLEKGKHLGAYVETNTATDFQVNFYATDKALPVNDPSLSSSGGLTPLASYEVKTYKDPDSTGIFPETDLSNIPQEMTVDLGHGIKGMVEGAAGSQYLTWMEGRWTLQIRSVSEDNMNNPGIAKKMVEYLESHTLPAPKDKGFVSVNYPSGGKSVNVVISWKNGQQIHQLKTSLVPNEALGIVASVK